jgi:hypothetical protein
MLMHAAALAEHRAKKGLGKKEKEPPRRSTKHKKQARSELRARGADETKAGEKARVELCSDG